MTESVQGYPTTAVTPAGALAWTDLDFVSTGGNWSDAISGGISEVSAAWAIDGNFICFRGAVVANGDFESADPTAYIARVPVDFRPAYNSFGIAWAGHDAITEYPVRLLLEGNLFSGHGNLEYVVPLTGQVGGVVAADAVPPRTTGLIVGLDCLRFPMS